MKKNTSSNEYNFPANPQLIQLLKGMIHCFWFNLVDRDDSGITVQACMAKLLVPYYHVFLRCRSKHGP